MGKSELISSYFDCSKKLSEKKEDKENAQRIGKIASNKENLLTGTRVMCPFYMRNKREIQNSGSFQAIKLMNHMRNYECDSYNN